MRRCRVPGGKRHTNAEHRALNREDLRSSARRSSPWDLKLTSPYACSFTSTHILLSRSATLGSSNRSLSTTFGSTPLNELYRCLNYFINIISTIISKSQSCQFHWLNLITKIYFYVNKVSGRRSSPFLNHLPLLPTVYWTARFTIRIYAFGELRYVSR